MANRKEWPALIKLLSTGAFETIEFKRIFNQFSDNIYYSSDTTEANAYLLGGATPSSSQTQQYLLRNEALCGVIAQLIGPSFRHNNVKLNFKPAGVGSAVEWHQDWGEPSAANSVHSGARTHSAVPAGFYPHTNGSVLAAGIFLDDIDSENGPCATRLAPLIRFARRILARARAS